MSVRFYLSNQNPARFASDPEFRKPAVEALAELHKDLLEQGTREDMQVGRGVLFVS